MSPGEEMQMTWTDDTEKPNNQAVAKPESIKDMFNMKPWVKIMTVCTENVLYQVNTKAFNKSKIIFKLLRKCSANQHIILLVEGEVLVKPLH